MKILLLVLPHHSKVPRTFLFPSLFDIPLNLCYLASYIPKKDKVKILDLNMHSIKKFGIRTHNKFISNQNTSSKVFKYITKILKEELSKKYDIIGINGDNYSICKIFIKKIKSINPKTKIILGGHVATRLWKKILNETKTDFIILGEGELIFKNLIPCLEKKGNLKKIKGIAFRLNKKLHRTEKERLLKSSEIKNPRTELVDLNAYYQFRKSEKSMPLLFSRGCIGNCIFCSRIMDYQVRFQNTKIFVDYIERLNKKFGFKNFSFYDNAINLSKPHLESLCKEIIKRKLKINWICMARIENLNEKTIKLMSKAGCRRISFGIETYSPRLIKLIKKNIDLKDAYEIIKNCKKHGILTRCFFIYDIPSETFKDLLNTIMFIIKSRIDIVLFYDLTIYLGAEIYEHPEKYFEHGCVSINEITKQKIRTPKEQFIFMLKHTFFESINKIYGLKEIIYGIFYMKKYSVL